MRALFSKIHNISFEKRNLVFRVIIPLVLFIFVLITPRFAFAGWLGEETIKNAILDIGRAFFAAGFWFVKMSVGYTTTVVSNKAVGDTWTSVRNVSLEVFGIVILVIAFMNVLKIQIQTWGVSRMIPRILLAVVLIIFSKFFCISLINFSHALVGSILTAGGESGTSGQTPQLFNNFTGLGNSLNSLQGNNGISLTMAFVVLIMCIIAFFVLLVLAIALLFRAVFLAFLIIVAPFAIAMYVLPWTEKYMQEWLKNLVKWVFFFPICILILWVGMTMVSSNSLSSPTANNNDFAATTGTSTQSNDFISNWSMMLVAFLAIPLSVYFPLKMLGAVGQGLQDRMSGKKGIPLAPFDPKSARDAWGDRSKKVEKGKKERTARMMKKGVRPLRRLTTNAEGEQRWGARYISKAGEGDVPSKGDRMKARNAVNRYFGDDEQMASAAASYINGDRTAYNALSFSQKRRFNRAKVAAGGDFKYGAVEHIKNRHEHIYSEHLRRETAAKAAYDSLIQGGATQAAAEAGVVGGARFAHGDGAFTKQSKAATLEGKQKEHPTP